MVICLISLFGFLNGDSDTNEWRQPSQTNGGNEFSYSYITTPDNDNLYSITKKHTKLPSITKDYVSRMMKNVDSMMKNVDTVDFNQVVPDGDFASPKDETLVPVIKNNLIANTFSPSNKEHDNSVIRSSTMIHPDNKISSNKNIVIKDYESEIGDDTFSSEENTLNFRNENDIGSSIPEAIQSSNSLKVEESEPVGTGIIEVTKIIKDVDSLEFERDHSDHDNNHHISKEGREITAHKHYTSQEKAFNDFKITTNIFEVKDIEFPPLRKSSISKNDGRNQFANMNGIVIGDYDAIEKDFNDFKSTTNIFEVKDLEFPSLRKSIERNINYQNVNTEVHSDKMVNKNERNLENKFQKLPTGVTNRKLNQRKAQTNNLKAADLKIQHRSESIDDDRESNHQEQHTSFDDYGESNQQEQHTSDDGESYQQEQHTSMFKRMNVEEQLRVDELISFLLEKIRELEEKKRSYNVDDSSQKG